MLYKISVHLHKADDRLFNVHLKFFYELEQSLNVFLSENNFL